MILIGSRALAIRAPSLLRKPPLDFDFLTESKDEMKAWLRDYMPNRTLMTSRPGKYVAKGESICEFTVIEPGSSDALLADIVRGDGTPSSFGWVPTLDMLFTLKQSHRHTKNSPHFWKTWADWHSFKMGGAKIRDEYTDFLKLREKETYKFRLPSLNQSKADFFGEDLNKYQYDHDTIHEAVAIMEKPAYRFFQRNESEVACSKEKFFACDREIQLNSVVEECAVLAVERSLVPHPGKLTPKKAWLLAYSKVCTSIASGYWRRFAFDNGPEIIRRYPDGYFERFQ